MLEEIQDIQSIEENSISIQTSPWGRGLQAATAPFSNYRKLRHSIWGPADETREIHYLAKWYAEPGEQNAEAWRDPDIRARWRDRLIQEMQSHAQDSAAANRAKPVDLAMRRNLYTCYLIEDSFDEPAPNSDKLSFARKLQTPEMLQHLKAIHQKLRERVVQYYQTTSWYNRRVWWTLWIFRRTKTAQIDADKKLCLYAQDMLIPPLSGRVLRVSSVEGIVDNRAASNMDIFPLWRRLPNFFQSFYKREKKPSRTLLNAVKELEKFFTPFNELVKLIQEREEENARNGHIPGQGSNNVRAHASPAPGLLHSASLSSHGPASSSGSQPTNATPGSAILPGMAIVPRLASSSENRLIYRGVSAPEKTAPAFIPAMPARGDGSGASADTSSPAERLHAKTTELEANLTYIQTHRASIRSRRQFLCRLLSVHEQNADSEIVQAFRATILIIATDKVQHLNLDNAQLILAAQECYRKVLEEFQAWRNGDTFVADDGDDLDESEEDVAIYDQCAGVMAEVWRTLRETHAILDETHAIHDRTEAILDGIEQMNNATFQHLDATFQHLDATHQHLDAIHEHNDATHQILREVREGIVSFKQEIIRRAHAGDPAMIPIAAALRAEIANAGCDGSGGDGSGELVDEASTSSAAVSQAIAPSYLMSVPAASDIQPQGAASLQSPLPQVPSTTAVAADDVDTSAVAQDPDLYAPEGAEQRRSGIQCSLM